MGLGNSVGIPLIVISRSDDHATTINTILRDSGHPVHCTRVNDLTLLGEQLSALNPELVLFFSGNTEVDLAAAAASIAQCGTQPPLLLVQNHVDEQNIATALEIGARDVVSLTHRNRLRAVVTRELHAHRLRVALEGVLSSARQYKQELRSLMSGASDAIVDIHDGIIVATNPAWAGLLGRSEEELIGEPFMDLFREADQATLKGALVACLRDKWQEGNRLGAVAWRKDGSELPLDLCLKRISIDGDPGVRLMVPGERNIEQPADEILQQAVGKDPSTGFFQRHYFLERLAAQLATPLEGGIRAIAYIRPDHFSRYRPTSA